MAAVGKTASGTPHKNKLVLKRIKILFQCFPGVSGTDAVRGIPGVAYTLKINGKVATKGATAADGGLTVDIPAGSKAVLEVFNTEYTIKILGALEAFNNKSGEQRRLQLLGYELGEVDGNPQAKTNNAALNFQADNGPLDPDGVVGTQTRNRLKTQFGE